MTDRAWVRELMLPLEEYATVSEEGTLQDALRALKLAQQKVRPGRQPHRAVIVQREDGTIVGKLGYDAILSALLPEQEGSFYEKALRRGGLSENIISTSMANLDLLQQDLPVLCDRARHIRIRELLLRTPQTISAGASDRDLLAAFVRLDVHTLLVTEGEEVVGIVRISDLFDLVTRLALGEEGAECTDEDR
jgi:CBS domain-containing protein